MTKGVESFFHNVYVRYTEIILQSQIFVLHVKGGMAVITAKESLDHENPKDTFNPQISSNNTA